MFEMPTATSISQFCCTGRAEGNARHSWQVWLCADGVVSQLAALVCSSGAHSCGNQERFMHGRHLPFGDQVASMVFRANTVCFFLAAPLCPLLFLWDITREVATLWISGGLNIMCSSWERTRDPEPPCSETAKAAEGGEDKADCPEVLLLRLGGERGQSRRMDRRCCAVGRW